jgi:hypothetical protein
MKSLAALLEELHPLAKDGSRLGKYSETFLELYTLLHATFGYGPSVVDEAMKEAYLFEQDTGRRPSRLYLGRDETRIMELWFRLHVISAPVGTLPHHAPRRKFNGMEIFEVDHSNHISVG